MVEPNGKRIRVWVQHFADRPHLMLQWLDPDTEKRKSKSAGTANPKDAEQARADLEYELNNGRYQEASRMTWEEFRAKFTEEYLGGRRPDTRRNYAATFDLFERLCGPARLRTITERTVSAFVAAMRKEPGRRTGSDGMMESTIKVRLQFLHTALAWAQEQKMIPTCPAFPSVRTPKRKPQPVPAESFERLLAKAPDDQLRAYLLCGWLAGLRLAEALALEWEETEKAPWVDLGRGRIVLPAAMVKAVEDQWVPLDAELRAALERLPRRGRKVFHFPSERREELTVNGVSQLVKALARKAGLKMTMKSLRRGFGCYYAARVPAQALQKLMRHASIKTTMDYYVNVDDAVEDAVRQRNTSRNSDRVTTTGTTDADAPTPCPPSVNSP
jgi:integrase